MDSGNLHLFVPHRCYSKTLRYVDSLFPLPYADRPVPVCVFSQQRLRRARGRLLHSYRILCPHFLCFPAMWPFSSPIPTVALNDLHKEYDYVIIGTLPL